MVHSKGWVYYGHWKDNKASGYGKYIGIDGSIYKGNWDNDKKSGFGKLKYPNDTKYQGNFKNSKKNGKGKFTWPNGSTYEGNWHMDKMYGIGIYSCLDGRVYTGKWVENSMNGYGEITWPNSERYYNGYFCEGKYNSIGFMKVKDKCSYVGEWKEGFPHGIGMCKKKGGKILKGEFSNGKFISKIDGMDEILDEFIDHLKKENEKDFKSVNIDGSCSKHEFQTKYSGSNTYHKFKASMSIKKSYAANSDIGSDNEPDYHSENEANYDEIINKNLFENSDE